MPIIPLVLIAVFLLTRRWLRRRAAWSTVKHPAGLYSFEYPSHWSGAIAPDGIQIASPNNQARLTAVAFTDDTGSPLSERAAMRFSVTTIAVTTQSLTPTREAEGPGWKGLVYEDEGPTRDTGVVVHETTLCAATGKVFVILGASVTLDAYAEHKEAIEHVLESLRLNAEAVDA